MVEFNKKVLKNGLTVLHEKRDVPVTTVMLATKFGSAYESVEEKGIAHFLEHMCFKGTEKRTAYEIAKTVEDVGGILNAFTHEEVTAYHVKLPSNHLELAMDVIFDVYFNPIFPREEVKKESGVICEEIKMYRDNPRAHSVEMIKSNLFGKPFGMFIAGTEEIVKGITREDLKNKHDKFYVPKNSVLVVVGKNDFEEVLKFADKFAPLEGGKLAEQIVEIKKHNLEESESRKDLHQSNLAIGFHFPLATDKNLHAAEVFSSILGDGMSSKLFTEVREKRGLVYGVKTDLDSGLNYGYLTIWAGTDPSKVEEVRKICLEEFGKMGEISEEDLEIGKEKVIGNHKVHLENGEMTALNLVLNEIYTRAEDFYDFEKNINSVSLDEIKGLASIEESAFFVVGP